MSFELKEGRIFNPFFFSISIIYAMIKISYSNIHRFDFREILERFQRVYPQNNFILQFTLQFTCDGLSSISTFHARRFCFRIELSIQDSVWAILVNSAIESLRKDYFFKLSFICVNQLYTMFICSWKFWRIDFIG